MPTATGSEFLTSGKAWDALQLPGLFYFPVKPREAVVHGDRFVRATRVCAMALRRGNIELSLPELLVIENRILAVRKLPNATAPEGSSPRKLWGKKKHHLDLYAVLIKNAWHTFLWSRSGNRIISYHCSGIWERPQPRSL